jgi:hypothetical protein
VNDVSGWPDCVDAVKPLTDPALIAVTTAEDPEASTVSDGFRQRTSRNRGHWCKQHRMLNTQDVTEILG